MKTISIYPAYLSAEFAEVLGMLTDLHLLHLLTQTGTITSTCRSSEENKEKTSTALVKISENAIGS